MQWHEGHREQQNTLPILNFHQIHIFKEQRPAGYLRHDNIIYSQKKILRKTRSKRLDSRNQEFRARKLAPDAPQDDLKPDWDFAGFAVLARLALDIGFEVANTDQWPT